MRKMNKKGIFFTLLAIALLSLFLVSYTIYSVVKTREAINKRVETLNNFVLAVERDLPRQLYVSGFRSIFLMENQIIEDDDYINDVDAVFQEIFFNGTIYGEFKPLMEGANFSGIQDSLNKKAEKINAHIELVNPSIEVIQEDPWHVKFSLEMDFHIRDANNLASWNRTAVLVSFVPIENFDDPVYMKNGLTNKINRTTHRQFVTGTNVKNLTSHLRGPFYINTTSAPSFLDRLEGKLDEQSEYGIESLVDKSRTDLPQAFKDLDKSVVDHIFFSGENPDKYRVDGMPPGFRIDDEGGRLDMYEIRALASPA